MLTLGTLIYLMIVLPILFSFSLSPGIISRSGVYAFCYSVLLLDSLVNLNTGTYENGIISNDRRIIVTNYIQRNFLSDIVGNITIFTHTILRSRSGDGFADQSYSFTQAYNLNDLILVLYLLKISQIQSLFKRIEER